MDGSRSELTRLYEGLRRDHPPNALDVGGVEWRYTAVGTGPSGLILFPGAVGGGEAFLGLVPLVADRCRLIMLSIPLVSDLDSFAEGLETILNVETIHHTAMIGSSFGGMLAQAYLFHRPERTTDIVLSATTPPRPGRAEDNERWHWVYRAIPMPLMRVLLRLVFRVMFRKVAVERDFWRRYYFSAIAEFTRADLECRYRLALEFDRRYAVTPPDLSAWKGRMLVVQGDADTLIRDESRELMQTTYPRAEVRMITGAGHGPLLERPAQWLDTVTRFLVRSDRTGATAAQVLHVEPK